MARESGNCSKSARSSRSSPRQPGALRQTSLDSYYFWWPPAGAALALGYGSLYNHAYHPTARFDLDPDHGVILFTAIQPISRNQEITINYNGEAGDLTPVWFDSVQ